MILLCLNRMNQRNRVTLPVKLPAMREGRQSAKQRVRSGKRNNERMIHNAQVLELDQG